MSKNAHPTNEPTTGASNRFYKLKIVLRFIYSFIVINFDKKQVWKKVKNIISKVLKESSKGKIVGRIELCRLELKKQNLLSCN